MKIYRVIDNGACILTTTDELRALRLYRKSMEAHDETLSWGWVDAKELE